VVTAVERRQRPALSAQYASKGYAVMRRFVAPGQAAAWEFKHRLLPGNKVHVGRDHHIVWTEQQFSDPSLALDGLAVDERFTRFVCSITGLTAIDHTKTQVWINRYGPGDHVPVHRDQAGDTQFLLCLQGLPDPEKGGDLLIRDEPVPLRTGDAVLFCARGVPHATAPVGSIRIGVSGFSRVTCVVRLFALERPARIQGASS
jgi:hypothetical protein